MKKTILTSLVLVCSLIAYAGNEGENEPGFASKFYIGHTQSADMNFYKSIDPKSGELIRHKGFSYTSGIQFEYKLCNKMSIVAGAKYTKRTFKTSVSVVEIETPSGEIVTNAELIKNDLKVLEIPLGVNLTFNSRTAQSSGITFTYLMYMGVSTSLSLSSGKTYSYNDGKNLTYTRDNGFSYVSITPEFGWGIEIQLCEKMKVDLLPVFRYDVLRSIKDVDTYEIPPMNKLSFEAIVSFAL